MNARVCVVGFNKLLLLNRLRLSRLLDVFNVKLRKTAQILTMKLTDGWSKTCLLKHLSLA